MRLWRRVGEGPVVVQANLQPCHNAFVVGDGTSVVGGFPEGSYDRDVLPPGAGANGGQDAANEKAGVDPRDRDVAGAAARIVPNQVGGLSHSLLATLVPIR